MTYFLSFNLPRVLSSLKNQIIVEIASRARPDESSFDAGMITFLEEKRKTTKYVVVLHQLQKD